MSYKRIIVNKKDGSCYFVKGSFKTRNYHVGFGYVPKPVISFSSFKERCENSKWRYGLATVYKITNRHDCETPKFYSVNTDPSAWVGEIPENLRKIFNDPMNFSLENYEEFLDEYKYYSKKHY